MKKLLKPACIGFYVLMLLSFFVLGLYFAAAIEAGKHQGLAGGAIVLGYGVLFGGIGFVASFFIAYFLELKIIKIINWILLLLLITLWSIKFFQFQQRDKIQEEKSKQLEQKSNRTPTAVPNAIRAFRIKKKKRTLELEIMKDETGMGFFSPNFYENPTLYFYGNLNLEKSLMDHSPYDSIIFKRNQYNQFEIATAPPWLAPDHLKLDYDMLYFKIISVTEEFLEVQVNNQNGQTSWVDKSAGKIKLWPDFLLGVHSVEFKLDIQGKVRSRDFESAGEVNTPYDFMKPIRVKMDWMEVLLIDSNYEKVGKGWIRWKKDGQLRVLYNLLS
jgi:Ca2+/Na+ antiporter